MDNDKYIGRLLDNRYEILEVIGSGGMAVVYKARCHRLNRLVAIKILRDDYLEDEDFRSRFHGESQAVAMFSHPNIVSVYDVSTSLSLEADYIVMELIDGISLKQYMEKKGVLNWKETLHFAIQIAKALEHAHSRGIVHRDIKPHNIMVLKNGSVKVADFGIARMMSKGNTLTKEALGSVHYISPEQAKGGRVDTRSDIYSLGVVMYEMMTGRPPYDGDSPVSVAIKHIDGGAPMPSTLNPTMPDGLEQIIMKAMAHNIDDRYDSASQMLADMEEFRKDPTMLFGYNAAALEALIQFPRKPVTPPPPAPPQNTAADRAVNRANSQRSQSQPQRRPPQKSSQKKRREAEEKTDRISTIAIIICSLLVVAGIAVILWFALANPGGRTTPEGQLITVPDWKGLTLESVLTNTDFELKPIDEYSETVEAGKVIRTDPAAGEKVAKGAKVQVFVSMGPAKTMLNLAQLTEEQARTRLGEMGLDLTVKVVMEYSKEIAVGKVVRTEPKAGDPLEIRGTVTLVISKGAEGDTMPFLEEVDEDIAKSLLETKNLDLDIKIEYEFNSTIAEGLVLRTNPEKGSDLKSGDTVTLYVSKGPEMKAVPPLVGNSLDVAKNSLWNAGFTKPPEIRYVTSSQPAGTVVAQFPEAYEEADVNTVVVLEVSEEATTKDVSITIEADTTTDPEYTTREVVIKRGDQVVLTTTVGLEKTTVVVSGQSGKGTVVYNIYINGTHAGTKEETF